MQSCDLWDYFIIYQTTISPKTNVSTYALKMEGSFCYLLLCYFMWNFAMFESVLLYFIKHAQFIVNMSLKLPLFKLTLRTCSSLDTCFLIVLVKHVCQSINILLSLLVCCKGCFSPPLLCHILKSEFWQKKFISLWWGELQLHDELVFFRIGPWGPPETILQCCFKSLTCAHSFVFVF